MTLVSNDVASLWDLLGQVHVANDRVRQRADIATVGEQMTPEEDLLIAGIKQKVAEADKLINEASKLVKDFVEERADGTR